MDWEGRSIRFGTGIVACAAVLRLGLGGMLAPVGEFLQSEPFNSFLIYIQTGRVVRAMAEPDPVSLTEQTVPVAQTDPPEALPLTFAAEELDAVELRNTSGYEPDLEALLTQPLDWDLSGGPTVLIVHTHTTESFTQTDTDRYEESSAYRTLDPEHNLICLGQTVARELEAAGIGVVHDTTLHDYPNYTGAYSRSAETVRARLAEYPTVRLVLDLHRDAAGTDYGELRTACTVDGVASSQLMMVVGTDAGGLEHPDWQENLALALKLQVVLQRQNSGICRPLKLTAQRYNQHLGQWYLLVEIGAAGDTLAQAKTAAQALAEGIIALAGGTVDS